MAQHSAEFLGRWAGEMAILIGRPDLETAIFVAIKLSVAAGNNLDDPAVRKDLLHEVLAMDMLSKEQSTPSLGC